MEYALPVESYLERRTKDIHFTTYKDAEIAISDIQTIIDKYGKINFYNYLRIMGETVIGPVTRRFMYRYGWKDVKEANVVCSPGYGDRADYFYISLPRPRDITVEASMFGDLREGDELIVKEFAPTEALGYSKASKKEGGQYLTWNQPTPIGRHVPNKITFVKEYPTHITVLADFDSYGGEKYVETIDKWKIKAGIVRVEVTE